MARSGGSVPLTHQAEDKYARWSPMTCLPKATLTPSGLLELDVKDGEVELMRRSDMELRSDMVDPMVPLSASGSGAASTRDKEWHDRDVDLTVTLTTHRLVFFGPTQGIHFGDHGGHVRYLHLSTVHHVAGSGGGAAAGGLFAAVGIGGSPKIDIHSYLGDLKLVFRGHSSGAVKDRDDLLQFLEKALERKAWETQEKLAQSQKKKASHSIASRKVGIDAIMTKSTLRHKEAAQLTDAAFQGDAETLLQEAAGLVKVIQKYVSTLETSRREHKLSGQEEQDATRLSDMLSNMGMTSALSRQQFRGSAGSTASSSSGGGEVFDDYTQTLARQLADFLRPKLPAAGGLLTLTDVYCLYNRARGTNLISPEDLLDAVACMKSLSLGMSQRQFPSGVSVIQSDEFDDVVMAQKLKDLALQHYNPSTVDTSGLTALEVSRALHISALLAHEQLLESEKMGYLCRDETLETTRFFPNLFDDFYNNAKEQQLKQ
jgi:ESCRT-II complex subunit VPS36